MTDNDIKKALECCIINNCSECPFYKNWITYRCGELRNLTLDLINRKDAEIVQRQSEYETVRKSGLNWMNKCNELQAEIEKFTKRQKPTGASGYKIENGKVVFFTNMLGGCRHEYENLDEVVKTLNELLQECYSKDEIAFALKCKTEDLKTAKSEAIKEFAELVKMEFYKEFDELIPSIMADRIDNLVKEMTEVSK